MVNYLGMGTVAVISQIRKLKCKKLKWLVQILSKGKVHLRLEYSAIAFQTLLLLYLIVFTHDAVSQNVAASYKMKYPSHTSEFLPKIIFHSLFVMEYSISL